MPRIERERERWKKEREDIEKKKERPLKCAASLRVFSSPCVSLRLASSLHLLPLKSLLHRARERFTIPRIRKTGFATLRDSTKHSPMSGKHLLPLRHPLRIKLMKIDCQRLLIVLMRVECHVL